MLRPIDIFTVSCLIKFVVVENAFLLIYSTVMQTVASGKHEQHK